MEKKKSNPKRRLTERELLREIRASTVETGTLVHGLDSKLDEVQRQLANLLKKIR